MHLLTRQSASTASSSSPNFNVTKKVIQAMFDKINRKAFQGRLPDIPLKVSSRGLAKTHYGWVRVKVYKTHQQALDINISTFFDMDYDTCYAIMAHEIVHYAMAIENIKDSEKHGKPFLVRAKRLGKALGIEVPITETANKLDIKKGKTYYVIALDDMFGAGITKSLYMNLISKSSNEAKRELQVLLATDAFPIKNAYVGTTTSTRVARLKSARSIGKIDIVTLSDLKYDMKVTVTF